MVLPLYPLKKGEPLKNRVHRRFQVKLSGWSGFLRSIYRWHGQTWSSQPFDGSGQDGQGSSDRAVGGKARTDRLNHATVVVNARKPSYEHFLEAIFWKRIPCGCPSGAVKRDQPTICQ